MKELYDTLKESPAHAAEIDTLEIPKEEVENFLAYYSTKLDRVNLNLIMEDIEKQQPLKDLSPEDTKKFSDEVFEQIKRFITRNDINLVELFMDSDEDDGYLDKNELKMALIRLGFANVSIEHLSAIFSLLDPHKTQRLDP